MNDQKRQGTTKNKEIVHFSTTVADVSYCVGDQFLCLFRF